jgi:hypothetical protein
MALSYDPASQVTNILRQIVSSATQINQAAYAYNSVGNRTSLTDRLNKRGRKSFIEEAWLRRCSGHAPMPLLDSHCQVRQLFDLVESPASDRAGVSCLCIDAPRR